MSAKESETELKLKLEDDCADLPEPPQEYVVPISDKNGTVVSSDVQFLSDLCMVSCMWYQS